MKKVFIGAGHGGADPGAIARDKQTEKDLNLSIAKACGAYLAARGVAVKYSRTRDTKAPAVIVECAFVDSADLAIIDTEAERVRMGEAIARGILRTLAIDDKPQNQPVTASKLYRVQTGAFKDKRNAEAEVARLARLGVTAIITT